MSILHKRGDIVTDGKDMFIFHDIEYGSGVTSCLVKKLSGSNEIIRMNLHLWKAQPEEIVRWKKSQ